MRTASAGVNALPLEILARVFELSKQHCLFDSAEDVSIDNFTMVCKLWRRVALENPQLWSHIDIGPVVPVALSELLLERSRDAPIHIHICEPEIDRDDLSEISCLVEDAMHVVPMLEPHISRARSIDFLSLVDYTELLTSTLDLWLESGNPSLVKSLIIGRPFCEYVTFIMLPKSSDEFIHEKNNSDEVLRSLRILQLQNVLIPWDSPAYQGLVDLRLDFEASKVLLSANQLTTILAANPALIVLKLAYLTITPFEKGTQPIPRTLEHLQLLDIERISPESLLFLLPLIALPISENVRAHFPADGRSHDTLQEFLKINQIARLSYCNCFHDMEPPSPLLLSSLSNITTQLVLEQIEVLASQQSIEASPKPQATNQIPDVYLFRCCVSFDGLNQLVNRYKIQRLHLYCCRLPEVEPGESEEELQTVKLLLLANHPNLECSIRAKSEGSVYMHPTHTWDSY